MHRNTRIPSQPESPTHEPSGSPTRPPVRRNLFSAHLSRRPASSQTDSQSQSPIHSQPPTQHQQLSPPPRPDFQHRQPSQNSPFASPPLLHPSFGDTYDPTISPNYPLSPNTSATLFPSSSIVAVHPVTGRPLLPTLPTLPPRLRLSEDDEDAEDHANDEEQEDDDAEDQGHDPFAPTQKPEENGYPHTAHSHAGDLAQGGTFTTDPQDDEADIARYERERFDSVVSDLMTRYRSRRQHRSSNSSQAHSLRGKNRATTSTQALRSSPGGVLDDDMEIQALEEKNELMAHLMAKLRQEVNREEEEGWMYGEMSNDQGREGEGMDDGGGYGGGQGGGGNGGGVNSQGMGGGMRGGERPSTAGGGGEVVAYE